MPAPTTRLDKMTCNCVAIIAPEDIPDVVVLPLCMLYLPNEMTLIAGHANRNKMKNSLGNIFYTSKMLSYKNCFFSLPMTNLYSSVGPTVQCVIQSYTIVVHYQFRKYVGIIFLTVWNLDVLCDLDR